jgi:hypothetical protein
MKIKKAGIIAAFIALGLGAVYPHVEAYRKSLPHHLTEQEAGKRYLGVVCPNNKIRAQLIAIEDKIKKETSIRYVVGSDALANANVRVGALSNNRLSLVHRFADAKESTSRKLSDPKFIWPENVKKDIVALSDQYFSEAASLREMLKGEEYKEVKNHGEADRIRRRLNLPVRGVCPPEYLK